MNDSSATGSSSNQNVPLSVGNNQSHLPESPPDSGSEPPYSPSDLHGIPPMVQSSTQDYHAGSSIESDVNSFLAENVLYLNGNGGGGSASECNNNSTTDGPPPEMKRENVMITTPQCTPLKHEVGLVLAPPQPPPPPPSSNSADFMLHQQGSVTLIELGPNRQFRNDMMDSLAVYNQAAPQPQTISMRPSTLPSSSRKRKASQCVMKDVAETIKPEPGKF